MIRNDVMELIATTNMPLAQLTLSTSMLSRMNGGKRVG